MEIETYVDALAENARSAARSLRSVGSDTRNRVLLRVADVLIARKAEILMENAVDLGRAGTAGLSSAMIDRLTLTEDRILAIANAVREIASFRDPLGICLATSEPASGIKIEKVSVAIGSILFIYESRPNVTIDGAALCLKSGNSVILRGGRESANSSEIFAHIFRNALQDEGVTENAVQLVNKSDREIVNLLLQRSDAIDVVIPRGGEGLIQAVVKNSKIPVIKHYKGLCHIYVDSSADVDSAIAVALNAKTQRPGVCNAMECLLLDKALGDEVIGRFLQALVEKNVEIFGDEVCRQINSEVQEATEESYHTEYLDLKLSMKVVNGVQEAIDHIEVHGSGHTEAILAENKSVQDVFLQSVDSSSVMVNASTRFSDGGEYGLGAEVGISTDKLHARGPMGVESLTSYKWLVRGEGTVRA